MTGVQTCALPICHRGPDIDPAEIGKVRKADVPIVGDARRVLGQLLDEWGDREIPDRTSWLTILHDWQHEYPLNYDQQPAGPIKPQYVIQ